MATNVQNRVRARSPKKLRRSVGLSLAAGALAIGAASAQAQTKLAWIEIEGGLAEQPSPFEWLLGPDAPATLRSVTDTVRGVGSDKSLDGMILRYKDASLKLSQIEELGEAIQEAQDAGKRVYFFAENYGGGELLTASYADKAIIQSGCAVMWTGLHAEEMYLADMLAWVGVKPDFLQVGDYKGASEMWARDAPSKYWDENIDGLLDALYANQHETIRDGRELSKKELDGAMEQLWLASAETAIDAGLIDAEVDFPELTEYLSEIEGDDVEIDYDFADSRESSLDMSNPFAMFSFLSTTPSHTPRRNTIAVVHVNGAIMDGDSTPAGPFGGSATAGSRTLRNALETVRDEDKIKGVVVRIDSPGGSAIASEVIWQGLQRVAEKKPVWISVGSMAASGGYYIAVGGDTIYAAPSSIVGSIGVVGGKFAIGGVYDKLKINIVERSRGPIAALMSSSDTWSSKERELIGERMTETYELFAQRVSDAREDADLDEIAEGRLFSGEQAKKLGMVDEVGGLHDAITDLAEELDLARYDVMDYPGPQGLEDLFGSFLGGSVRMNPQTGAPELAPSIEMGIAASLERLLGADRWPVVRDAMNAMWQMRSEPVLLTTPRVLIVR